MDYKSPNELKMLIKNAASAKEPFNRLIIACEGFKAEKLKIVTN